MMNQRYFRGAVIIIGIAIGITFLISIPRTVREVPTATPSSSPPEVPSVGVDDTFRRGQRVITGWFLAPTACTTVTATSTLMHDSDTDRIIVLLTVPDDSQVCLRVPTRIPFSTSLTASPSAPLRVLVNGATATTTAL